MKEKPKHNESWDAEQEVADVADFIEEMRCQLDSIEQKLDILINKPVERSFDRSYSSGGSKRFDKPVRYNKGHTDNRSRDVSFTKVNCAKCNKECEVPFKPTGDRPVYCKDCFSKSGENNRFQRNRSGRTDEKKFSKARRPARKQADMSQWPGQRNKSDSSRKKRA
ncbi:MAG: hypothetical protein PHC58_05485 [Candidatus Omnitrophica bacterium]|nr:hypothetical protein [Candidatus Omnitrophota bacterium]